MRTCLLLPLAALLATVASAGFITLPDLEGPAKILVDDVMSFAPQRRGFNAQDSKATNVTCFVPFLTAQAVVDFKCPYINSWLNKTTEDDDMMKKACNDGCSDLVVATYSTFTSCFGSDSKASKVLTKLRDCKLRGRCNSVNALAQLQSLKNDCLNPLTNFSNFSTSIKATIDSVCTNDCLSRAASYAKSYPECLPNDSTNTVSPSEIMNYLGYLCSRPTNTSDRCAWTLRSLSRGSCGDEGACSKPGYWCSRTSTGSCVNTWNNTVLREYCSPCMKGLGKFSKVLEVDSVALSGNVDFYCGQVNPRNATSDYCYPIASNVLVTAPVSAQSVDQTCSGDSELCAPRLLAAFGTLIHASAWSRFKTCMKNAGSTADSCIESSALLDSLRSAEQYRQLSDILCATNSNSSFCYPMAYALRFDSCYFSGQQGVCPTGCAASGAKRLANMGCCLPLINAYLKLQSSYRAGYLPTGNVTAVGYNGNVTFNFSDTHYADASEPTQAQQPVNAFAACSNSSALWNQLGSTCAPSSNALSRSIDMPVAYDTVKGNPSLFNKMLAAMRSDMIKALGRSCIKNDTFQRNQRVKVKTSSSGTSSRRAASTTSDGMTYSFYVDAGASSASVAAAFDTQVSSGALSFTDTASVISTSCTSGCLDSSASLTNIVEAVSDSVASATTLAPGATAAPVTPSPTYYNLPTSSDAFSRTCAVLAMVLATALALLQ